VVAESSTWTEEVVSGSEDDHCTSFLGGLCPRDREVCGACATTKFTKGDWGGSEDMVFPIERDGCGDSSLTQLSTPKEGAYGDHPDGRMERVSEVDAVVQGHKVLNGYWSMESTFVSHALFISRSVSELDPVIITIPRHMIDEVPAANAGHPGSDGTTSLVAFVLTNESTEEAIRCWHVGLFVDVPMVTELGETEEASGISSLGIWCKCAMDGHYSGLNE